MTRGIKRLTLGFSLGRALAAQEARDAQVLIDFRPVNAVAGGAGFPYRAVLN